MTAAPISRRPHVDDDAAGVTVTPTVTPAALSPWHDLGAALWRAVGPFEATVTVHANGGHPMSAATELYAFTFGVGHRNRDRFVTIEAANEIEARLRMIDVYGRAWSSVYVWDDFVPMIERYGYTELPFGENAGGA